MRFPRILSVIALLGALSACGAGKTIVLEPAQETVSVTTVKLEYDGATVGVPDDAVAEFKAIMEKEFFGREDAIFTVGNELTVKYGFVSFEQGNRFSRWFFGGIGNAGEGSLMIQAEFLNPDGDALGKIQAEGKIGSGFFGGSYSNAMEKAAEEIAAYAEANFR